MKKTLSSILILSLLCALMLAIPVSAADEDDYLMDWDSVDWDSFRFGDYFDNPDYDFFYLLDDWSNWMENEATLEKLMEVAKARPDAAYSTAYANALGTRFLQAPQAVIRALAQADGDHREQIARLIATSEAYPAEQVDIAKLLTELKLPADATAEEKAALNMIIGYVEQYNNVEIPRTGDPIGLIIGLMALSATGLAVMVKRNERG